MALSAFDDKSKEPNDRALAAVLGPAKARWDELKAVLAVDFDPLSEAWSFAGKNWGWSLRLKRKKRTLLYLTPCDGHFLAGFALGEKAVQAARERQLPSSVLAVIEAAPKYAEGRGVRLAVRDREDAEQVRALAAVKMAN